jgi:hypothetical protein
MADRIVLVTKPTRLEELVQRHLTVGAARFFLQSCGQSIDPYQFEHDRQYRSLNVLRRNLPPEIPLIEVTRADLPSSMFREKDLIVVSGPDGLFVNTSKYIDAQPIITVNPDPQTIVGEHMLFTPNQVGDVIARVQAGTHRLEALPFVKALIDNDREVWGINDIFIGRKDHVSARYEIKFGSQSEHHSSSGIIVSTGVGSSGWLCSITKMVEGLIRPGQPHKLIALPSATKKELVFVVREAFPSPNTDTSLITGRVVPGKPLTVISQMPEGGYIFSDGVIEKASEWNAGSTVVVTVGDRFVNRVIP